MCANWGCKPLDQANTAAYTFHTKQKILYLRVIDGKSFCRLNKAENIKGFFPVSVGT